MNQIEYRKALPGKRMGAGALFLDGQDRLLLVQPVYKDEWEIPGGIVEADESPWSACQREVREELGLTLATARLLAVDWVPASDDRTEGLMFVFDGGYLKPDSMGQIRLKGDELSGFAFCSSREVEDRVPPRMARRLAACLEARKQGSTVYLEDGVLVP